MSNDKQDALAEILQIAKNHELTLNDISNAFHTTAVSQKEKSSGIAAKIFGYMGGLLILGGLCVLIRMQWDSLNSLGRVCITLIPGFLAFALAVYFNSDKNLEKAATPVYLLAAIVEPTGILITLKEYAHGYSSSEQILFICFVMLVQQGLTFYARQRTALAFTSMFFGLSFVATYLDMHHLSEEYVGLIIGSSELCIAYALSQSRHNAIAPINYFFGSVIFLSSYGDLVFNKSYDLTFLGIACLFIYGSIILRSRILLGVSAVAMLAFISYYSSSHFAHTIGWPITLILGGALMIALGIVVVKINNSFISNRLVRS